MAMRRRVARSRPLVRGSVEADRVIEPPPVATVEEREPEQLTFDF